MANESTFGSGPRPISLGGARAWFVWGLAVTFVIYYFSFQTGYAIVNPKVQKDIGLTVAQVATVAAMYTWIFAICQFLSGPLLDRVGAGKVIPPAIALVTAGIFLFAKASSFEMLLLSQFVIAVGACTGFVGAGYIGGQWFGMAKFSFMFGLVQFAASFFSAFNQTLLTFAIDRLDWRALFFSIGIFGVALFALGAAFIRNPPPVTSTSSDGVADFFRGITQNLLEVSKVPHLWLAAAFGAFSFGTLLSLGIVWGPKLLAVRGFDAGSSNWAAPLLWLGLAAGCLSIPRWSDLVRNRKIPILTGLAVQTASFALLLYLPEISLTIALLLCFTFGFGSAAHMLAFSTAADVVKPQQIGTSAAIVNGIMFIMGGIMIQRPGMRIGAGIEAGIEPASMAMAQYAEWPLMIALILAIVIAVFIRETYPTAQSNS